MANSWYIEKNGVADGPFPQSSIEAWVRNGTIKDSTNISNDGVGFWPASKFFVFEGDCAIQQSQPVPQAEAPRPFQPQLASLPMSGSGVVERYRPGQYKHGDRDTITCPHCWTVLPLEDALYIAKHPDLVGDPLLGNDAAQRFKPSRFTPQGQAIDPGGMPTGDLACPNCHLETPRCLAEMRSIFFSIVGAPGCGKSYYLAAMTWQLRQALMEKFAFSMTDAETTMNAILNQYEEQMFMNSEPESYFAPTDLVRKTEKGADLYNRVDFYGQVTTFSKPFVFSLSALDHNPVFKDQQKRARAIVLYDNAGEHFLPGADTSLEPTPHLSRSRGLFFIFDPTKDARFRGMLGAAAMPSSGTLRLERQDVVLNELARRVRKQLALAQQEKTKQPLVMIVSKLDLWDHLLKVPLKENPYIDSPQHGVAGLDLGHVDDVSFSLRSLLLKTCPELVAAAESFSQQVTYVPVSSLGAPPIVQSGQWFVRPAEIRPRWVTVPFLYALHGAGLLLGGAKDKPDAETATVVRRTGGMCFCQLSDGSQVQVPMRYAGRPLHHPDTGVLFVVPKEESLVSDEAAS